MRNVFPWWRGRRGFPGLAWSVFAVLVLVGLLSPISGTSAVEPPRSDPLSVGYPWRGRQVLPFTGNAVRAVATNRKLYALASSSGPSSVPPVSPIQVYIPETDTWSIGSSMPNPRAYAAMTAGPDGKIYLVGGLDASRRPTSTVELYDPLTDTWSPRASLPLAIGSLSMASGPDGKIHVFGSEMSDAPAVLAYDPTTDTWVTRGRIPDSARRAEEAAGSRGKIYLFGDTTWEYDPRADTWAIRTSMPSVQGDCPRSGFGVAAAKNSRIYVVGGVTSCGAGLYSVERVEVYEPGADIWANATRLPRPPRTSPGLAQADNGFLYAIGGTWDEKPVHWPTNAVDAAWVCPAWPLPVPSLGTATPSNAVSGTNRVYLPLASNQLPACL